MGGAMGGPGGVEYADPDAIRALGENIVRTAGASVRACLDQLPLLKAIEHSNFTSTTLQLALTYVAAVEFLEEQVKGAEEHLTEMRGRLNEVAANWEKADQASDMRPR
jgi:hypothetical protein